MTGIPTDPAPVLAAVNVSESAHDAAAWAAELAADWSAPLELLHVPLGDPNDAPPAELPAWLGELADMADRVGARPCTVRAQPGDVVATLAVRSAGARILVLGSYGAGSWSGTLVGTVALGVLGRACCPVAVVRGSAPRIPPPRGGAVVVGVDGTDPVSTAALAFAADTAASLGAQLVAVHTWADVEPGPDATAHRRDEPPTVLAAEAAAVLEGALRPVRERLPQLSIEARVESDRPLRALLRHATTARMLVVGTRRHTGETGMLMGSTSQALVEFAPCPVVVVPPAHPGTAAPDEARALATG